MLALQDVEPPEGKEDTDPSSRGGCAVGKNEGRQRLIQIVIEEDEGLVALPSASGSARLLSADAGLLLATGADEAMSRTTAPGLGIAWEAHIRSTYLEARPHWELVHSAAQLEDGAWALETTGIEHTELRHRGRLLRSYLCASRSLVGIAGSLDRSRSRTVGLDPTDEVAHLAVALPSEDVGGKVATQPHAAEEP